MHIGTDNCDLYHDPQYETWYLFILAIAHLSQMKTGYNTQSRKKNIEHLTYHSIGYVCMQLLTLQPSVASVNPTRSPTIEPIEFYILLQHHSGDQIQCCPDRGKQLTSETLDRWTPTICASWNRAKTTTTKIIKQLNVWKI